MPTGTFYAPTNLKKINETLQAHEPYAAIVVSTTGLDNGDFKQHSPTRVVIKQFEYDNELKAYNESYVFDQMVKAPEEAVKKALEVAVAGGYDAFAMGAIDKDAYQKGTNVLSVEDFQKKFTEAVEVLRNDKATVIANNKDFVIEYLGKIGCADTFKTLDTDNRLLDQVRLTQEFLQQNAISYKTATLETLRDALRPSPSGSFYKDKEKMKGFFKLSKEDFLKEHSDITEKQYDITARDVERRETLRKEGIVGGDKRIAVINNFVTQHGRNEHILEDERQSQQRESEAAYIQEMSERGKENYKKDGLKEKYEFLIEKGHVKPDEILAGKSEFHKLVQAVEDKGNKGIVIMHAASTGMERGKPLPAATGFPIRFSALYFERDKNGKIDFGDNASPYGIDITIQAPAKSLAFAKALKDNPTRPYDTFAEAGIDYSAYMAGENVTSADEAREQINRFFKSIDLKNAPIVAIGGTNGSTHSFTQECIKNLGNFAVTEAPHIDITQVIKDYVYLVSNDNKYPENVLFTEEQISGKNLGIQDVAKARGEENVKSPFHKCCFAVSLIDALEQQQTELFRPSEKETVKTIATAQPASEPKRTENKSQATQESDKTSIGSILAQLEENNRAAQTEQEEETEEERRAEREARRAFAEAMRNESAEPDSSVPERRVVSRPNTSQTEKKPENTAEPLASGIRRFTPPSSVPKTEIVERKVAAERTPEQPRRFFPKKQEETEQKATPAANSSKDVSELIKVIAQQSQIIAQQGVTISEQNKTISAQNEKLLNFLQEQNQLMRAMLEISHPEINLQKDNVIASMENIKEHISELSNQISDKASTHLVNANKSISDAQKVVELDEHNMENKKNRTA